MVYTANKRFIIKTRVIGYEMEGELNVMLGSARIGTAIMLETGLPPRVKCDLNALESVAAFGSRVGVGRRVDQHYRFDQEDEDDYRASGN
ncbi:MAG: hypothetical protein E4H01_13590 [Lysobacterales bacterium]|nr:MAG: hypothetical protein E4H01_13590 [Xanthomonadales bacterium]